VPTLYTKCACVRVCVCVCVCVCCVCVCVCVLRGVYLFGSQRSSLLLSACCNRRYPTDNQHHKRAVCKRVSCKRVSGEGRVQRTYGMETEQNRKERRMGTRGGKGGSFAGGGPAAVVKRSPQPNAPSQRDPNEKLDQFRLQRDPPSNPRRLHSQHQPRKDAAAAHRQQAAGSSRGSRMLS